MSMAEEDISESPTPPPAHSHPVGADQLEPNGTPVHSDRRPTRPGTKRLFLTLSVLLSFILGLPFLIKSTSIHRAPLPFASIAALSSARSLPTPPLRFHALFLLRHHHSRDAARRLHSSISRTIKSRIGNRNFSLYVTVDSSGECFAAGDLDHSPYTCGTIFFSDLVGDDDAVDEILSGVLGGGRRSECYTVVVVEREGDGWAVVGKHRHAWVAAEEMTTAAEMAGKIFSDVFANGGKDVGKAEFVPVGSDGNLVLSFSLLNADPEDWVYDWEFEKVSNVMLAPVVEALAPVANISIESQVLYHTPKSFASYWDDSLNGYRFSTNDLPFFVNSNEWHLDTSTGASGRSKVLQLVVYVPSAKECPLILGLPEGEISKTNGFISPMWGGVVVWNPPRCYKNTNRANFTRNVISPKDLQSIFQVFIGQLRLLFGLRPLHVQEMGVSNILASARGFTQWELDVLYRHHTSFNLKSCVSTLDSLSKLVQSLPRMIVLDEIGKQVDLSLEAAVVAQQNLSLGLYDASAVSSRKARALSEDAFFHPSIMSISYASTEHYFAIYMPFFAPVSLHVILAVLYELKRYKRERKKYLVYIANPGAAS